MRASCVTRSPPGGGRRPPPMVPRPPGRASVVASRQPGPAPVQLLPSLAPPHRCAGRSPLPRCPVRRLTRPPLPVSPRYSLPPSRRVRPFPSVRQPRSGPHRSIRWLRNVRRLRNVPGYPSARRLRNVPRFRSVRRLPNVRRLPGVQVRGLMRGVRQRRHLVDLRSPDRAPRGWATTPSGWAGQGPRARRRHGPVGPVAPADRAPCPPVPAVAAALRLVAAARPVAVARGRTRE